MPPLVTVRPATIADARDLWLWRNDDLTRTMSRDTGEVPWLDHRTWFEQALTDPLRTILIGELGDDDLTARTPESIGMCRFDADPTRSEAEVSIVVAPAMRGRGLAQRLLAAAITAYHTSAADRTMQSVTFRATIRNDNPASIACFERNGFTRANTGPLFSTYERRPD